MDTDGINFNQSTALFSLPLLNTQVEKGLWVKYKSLSNFATGNIKFEIKGERGWYIDLLNSELDVKFGIFTNANPPQQLSASEIENKKLGLVNNVLHSLFQQIDVRFGSTLLETSESLYNYKAYFENHLNFSSEAKQQFLKLQGYIQDESNVVGYVADINNAQIFTDENNTVKAMDGSTDKKEDIAKNPSILKRNKILNDGTFHFVGPLRLDTFRTRYLLPLVDVNLTLTRTKDEFVLMYHYSSTTDKFQIMVQDISLNVRKVQLSDSFMSKQIESLSSGITAKYPIRQTKMIQFNLTAAQETIITNIHHGSLPKRIIFGFVRTKALAGDSALNPYNFEHINISSLKFTSGVNNISYNEAIRMNYSTNDYINAYNLLFTNIRQTPNGITYEEYKNGNVIYAFDLSPDLNNGDYYNLTEDGTLNLVINFEKDKLPTKAYTIVFYLEFDNIFEIDNLRTVRYNKHI